MRWILILSFAASLCAQNAADKRSALDGAIADMKAGRKESAIQKLKALSAEHSSPEVRGQARLELARIYQRDSDWLNAIDQFAELRRMASDDAEYAFQLGSAYRNTSRWALMRMREVAPASARMKQMEAEQLAATGDVGKAIKRYQDAIAADGALRGAHLGLAMLYARSGKRAEALSEIDEELKIAPESFVAKQIKRSLESAAQ